MEADLRILMDLKSQIERSRVNFKKSSKERITPIFIEIRLEALEKQFGKFSEKHTGLISKYEPNELNKTTYIKEDLYQALYDTYLNYKVELKSTLSKFKNDIVSPSCSETSKQSMKSSCVKLPKISIPKFSGKYTEWSTFRDLFISLIQNNETLDDVQRLHYLKTQLTGEAEQLIRHIPITQSNYKKCWQLLTDRYNNKKFMSNCILKRLFSQRNITCESSNSLKELLDSTTDCLHELSNLGIDIKSWDVIIIYIISLKLDVETRKQWELYVSQLPDELPTFKQLKEYLETRFRALEFVEPSKSKTRASYANVNNNPKALHVTSNFTCPHCSEGHRLYNCKQFAKEDVDKRRNIVQSLGLCFNCLGYNHSNKICRVTIKCRICKRRHHTLLHPKSQVDSATCGVAMESTCNSNDTILDSPKDNTITNIATHFLKDKVQTIWSKDMG
ncbi:unnamed protein product [Parnassius mnemosyne]|uniref:Gag-pol polyprotein n=1 Tax=Parnassius mnemosyne TaxID=213953 RepID=A0AAV1LBR0_9NEOP